MAKSQIFKNTLIRTLPLLETFGKHIYTSTTDIYISHQKLCAANTILTFELILQKREIYSQIIIWLYISPFCQIN
jgi:hypothetical protein